jgi:hypothetical protein
MTPPPMVSTVGGGVFPMSLRSWGRRVVFRELTRSRATLRRLAASCGSERGSGRCRSDWMCRFGGSGTIRRELDWGVLLVPRGPVCPSGVAVYY